jgi:hypothetical protein
MYSVKTGQVSERLPRRTMTTRSFIALLNKLKRSLSSCTLFIISVRLNVSKNFAILLDK